MTGVSVACPAKINLFLRILAREDSGYHQIETLFQAVGLYDRVDAHPARGAGIALEVRRGATAPGSGDIAAETGDPENNTVARAARAFFAATGIAPSARLVLTKAIPAGTGLGGASSDAAGTLAALNVLHGEPLARDRLVELGGRIGADAPFFCCGAATALGWGRGDRLLACPPPPSAPLVLVVPRERTSTATAYRTASTTLPLPAASARVAGIRSGDWPTLAALQENDFERVAFARTPRLREMRDALASRGALAAGMTGSGSAIFGVFGDRGGADEAAAELGTVTGVEAVAVVPTLTGMPVPTRRECRAGGRRLS